MCNKKDLTNLTDKLWQNSDFFFKQANRKRKYSQKRDIKSIYLYLQNLLSMANVAF